LGVTVTTTEALARNNALPGVADSERFLSTGFSLDEMAISDVQDLGDGFYIIQTLEKIPSQIPSFEAVQARVQQDLLAEKQWAQADADAQEMLQALRAGATLADLGQARDITPQTTGWFKRGDTIPDVGFEPGLAAAAFKLSSVDPYPEKAVRGEKGVFVFRYVDRQIPDAQSNAAELDAIKEQLRQRKQREIYGNWMTQARNQPEIEIEHALLK
jgi:peptidyl-prolyl cis-trans isomerase D